MDILITAHVELFLNLIIKLQDPFSHFNVIMGRVYLSWEVHHLEKDILSTYTVFICFLL